MHFNRKHLISFILALFLLGGGNTFAQTYLFFQDSPTPISYDFSWMELTAPSELERMGSEFRKFPVESVVPAQQGINCLRLKWKSLTGGDWVAIAAGANWETKNLSQSDTLTFWLRSVEGLNATNLPKIFMEDINNVKTTKHSFSAWSPSTLTSGNWSRIAVPMSLFLDYGDLVDFTNIKTIGFTQNLTDGVTHTLFVDDMRVFTGSGSSPPAAQPTGVTAQGYDSHAEITWNPNSGNNLNGYEVQRSSDGGSNWVTVAVADRNSTRHIDWVRPLGTTLDLSYRIRALNASNEPSLPSEPSNTSTHVFSDDELMDMVQEHTFRYFYDFAHPASGMSRERNTSGDVVTSGGSGFGIMALLTGIERGFITREEGIAQMVKILNFLETADRFHGVWPHWLNGNTGHVVSFSENDDGGDLVETGFLVQGLLTARQYFNQAIPPEQSIVTRITALWETVEWDWYSRNNSGALYWHWSPNYGWQINMQIRGWNEAAIIYMLAIASPTHPVNASYWNNGWAGMSYYRNGKTFYGYTLDVGWDRGGPLFFAHYSFLGFDPRSKKDNFTNYFNLNRNHTLINRAYCMQNPLNHTGYGQNCWGLTASDDPFGYQVHEPVSGRDNGTITPTAALSSMPYTPVESLGALKHFYRELGAKTWGWMGFYDAFNQRENWWADSYLAIDQGPIVVMIENSRSQLLWNHFMANPEIGPMLEAIGFTYDANAVPEYTAAGANKLYPNPAGHETVNLMLNLNSAGVVNISVCDLAGRVINEFQYSATFTGSAEIPVETSTMKPGIYIVKFNSFAGESGSLKLLITHQN